MATLRWILDVNSPNAAKTFDEIGLRMTELDRSLKKTREITVGDRDAMAKIAQLQIQAERLKDRIHDMPLTIEGAARAEAQLLGLEASAERLQGKMGGGGIGGIAKALGALSGAGGGAGGLGAIAGGIAAIGAATPVLGTLVVTAVQAAGALAAAGAGLGSFAVLALPTVKNLTTQLGTLSTATDAYQQASNNLNIAIHKSPADLKAYQATIHGLEPDLQAAAKLLTNQHAVWQNLSPSMRKSVVALHDNAAAYKSLLPSQKTALTALLAQKAAWDELNPRQQIAARSIQALGSVFDRLAKKLEPITFKVLNDGLRIANKLLPDLLPFATAAGKALDGLLKGLDKFVTAPKMPAQFAAFQSLLPPTGFQKFLTQMQALSGPAITALGKGLGQITIAVGKLILAAAQPQSIRALTRVLGLLAFTINAVTWVITRVSLRMEQWMAIAHQTANKFDEFRHDTARVFAAVATIFDKARHAVAVFGHGVAAIFDGLRHTVAVIWDTIWNNTVRRAERGAGDLLRFLGGLPGKIKNVFHGALTWLYTAGKNVIQGLWNGLLFIWHKVTSFISGIASWIKSHKGPVSLDASLLEPAGRALMSGLLRGLVGGFGGVAGFIGGVAGRIASFFGFHGGGSVVALGQRMAASMGWTGSQWNALFALWQRESGWNPNARNPSSGAAGIPQDITGNFHGGALGQILWGLRYILGRYGSPAAAWAHEIRFGWYGSGLTGGIFNRPTLIGVGERGPERVDVTPVGAAGASRRAPVQFGDVHIHNETDLALLAQKLGFAITTAGFGGGLRP